MSESDEAIATTLRDLGAVLRLNKNGKILVLDFRPVKDLVSDVVMANVMAKVEQVDRLRELYLDGTVAADNSLGHLIGLAKLTTLDLQNTAITDAGIALLKSLPSLKLLLLNGTQVTREGIAAVRKTMLNTRIAFTG